MATAMVAPAEAVTDTVRAYLVVWRTDRTAALQLSCAFNAAIRRCQQILQAEPVRSAVVIDLAFRRVVYQCRRSSQ